MELVFGVILLGALAFLGWVLWSGARQARPVSALPPAVDGSAPVPGRWESKLLLMLCTGPKDVAVLTKSLWPDALTARGALLDKAVDTMRAVLHPMLVWGWIARVPDPNPGVWVYAIQDAGYDALRRAPPVVEVWQTDPLRRTRAWPR